jgi:MoaA/NifB/PqqE/SkfB family radical SAM enzyme
MSLVQRYLLKVPQYTRNARHLRAVLEHGTASKLANLAMAETERKLRRVKCVSKPYLLIIDPCNYCNLRCPLCPTGLNDLGRQQSMLSLEHFKKYFDPLAPNLFEAYMHNWGESMLNKQVFSMIRHAQDNNVGTNLSSNFVRVSSDDMDQLLDSGLEYLVISLDGTSQEVYSQYRVNGDYDQVVANLREFLKKRAARKVKLPVVEWQFIVMKQNEHQVEEAERLAKEIGVDLLRFVPVGMPYEFKNRKETADQWYPASVRGRTESDHSEQQFGQAEKPSPCFYLYRSMVVNPDGGVSPCCVVYRKNRDFADLSSEEPLNMTKIWNNDKYLSARSLFSKHTIPNRRATVCDGCDIFSHHPSKIKVKTKVVEPPLVGITQSRGKNE